MTGEGGVSDEEYDLLMELAQAVHEMAPPDSQRRIKRAVDAWLAAIQRHLAEDTGYDPSRDM